MLRFYKKLEENFLNLSGFSKYLIYGVTEIILLVVGVVIALQVNSWGEQRNNSELEKYYLGALQEQVAKDIDDVKSVIEHNSSVLDGINSLLTLAKENKSISDESSMLNWASIFITSGTNPNTIVFDDMKSSGRINLVSSPGLRFQIQEYYDYIEEAHADAAANTQLIYRWFNEYFINFGTDINTLYSTISPTIVEVNSYNPTEITPDNITPVIDRLSVLYTLTELNISRHFNSLELAKNLEIELTHHLEEID